LGLGRNAALRPFDELRTSSRLRTYSKLRVKRLLGTTPATRTVDRVLKDRLLYTPR